MDSAAINAEIERKKTTDSEEDVQDGQPPLYTFSKIVSQLIQIHAEVSFG